MGRFSRVEHVERVDGEVRMGNECVERLKALATKVGQVAYAVHEYFGVGLLEKVYETALVHRLLIAGFTDSPVALLVNFGSYKFERRTVVASSSSTRSTCSTRQNLGVTNDT